MAIERIKQYKFVTGSVLIAVYIYQTCQKLNLDSYLLSMNDIVSLFLPRSPRLNAAPCLIFNIFSEDNYPVVELKILYTT